MDGRYAVDNISINEITDTTTIPMSKVFSYPNPDVIKIPPITSSKSQKLNIDKIFYFNLEDSQLNVTAFKTLDSLSILLEKANFSTVIDIIGHTDSTGTKQENDILSNKRTEVIYNYLLRKGVPFYCMNKVLKGSTEPLASNTTKGGRAMNRRVQIVTSEYELSEQLYYYGSKYAEARKIDSAYFFLQKWSKIDFRPNKTIIFLDSDLEPLKKDTRWLQLYTTIKSSFSSFKNPELAFQLDSLYNVDQLFRTVHFEYEKKYEPQRFDTLSIAASEVLMEKLDKANLNYFKTLYKKYGWPKVSEVGIKAAKTAYYIIDHSNAQTMKAFLPILESTCKENEADWEWYATMYDRIQMLDNKPQKYGTQYVKDPKNPNHYILHTLENSEKVNEYREKLGIGKISHYEFYFKSH